MRGKDVIDAVYSTGTLADWLPSMNLPQYENRTAAALTSNSKANHKLEHIFIGVVSLFDINYMRIFISNVPLPGLCFLILFG